MRAARIAAALAVLSGLGCSLLMSTAEPTQCATQRDCDADPAFRDRVCEQGFCVVPRASAIPEAIEAGAGCTSTDLCTQANSGKASVCEKAGGPCTPWQTEQCRTIHGAWRDPNAIVIGSILPFFVKQANGALVHYAYAERVRRAIDLGLGELNAALPDGVAIPGGPSRPFAVLHCDSYSDPELARAAMTHLTDVVGAPAVIVGGDLDLAAVRAQVLAKKTAIVCSDCIAPSPPGLLPWRIVPSLSQEAAMAAWRVGELETAIRGAPGAPAAVKVAVLASPTSGPSAFVSELVQKLHFNGKSVAKNGDAFTVRTTEDPTKAAVNYAAHADALAAFEPDVLVVAMGEDFAKHYLRLLEAKWSTRKPKPHYVMTIMNFEIEPIADAVGSDDALRRRLSGTRPAFDEELQANVDAFTTRYRKANNYTAPDGNFSGYDAFYAMGYAIAAASIERTLDGPRIDAAFARLTSGTTIDVGPNRLGTGLVLLGAKAGTIDLRGLLSHLDWDPATRDLVVREWGLYCFERAADGALMLKADAGPRLDTKTGTVTGAYACD